MSGGPASRYERFLNRKKYLSGVVDLKSHFSASASCAMAAVGLGAARSLGHGAARAYVSSRATRVTASAVSTRGAATATAFAKRESFAPGGGFLGELDC